MLREFSKELVEDRQFEIGGELFEWRYPFWEDFADRREADAQIVRNPDATNEITFKEMYKDFIDRCEPFIDPKNDSIKRWRALAKRRVDPVPAYQFTELYQWLLEVTSGRPTEQPSPSPGGRGKTGAS